MPRPLSESKLLLVLLWNRRKKLSNPLTPPQNPFLNHQRSRTSALSPLSPLNRLKQSLWKLQTPVLNQLKWFLNQLNPLQHRLRRSPRQLNQFPNQTKKSPNQLLSPFPSLPQPSLRMLQSRLSQLHQPKQRQWKPQTLVLASLRKLLCLLNQPLNHLQQLLKRSRHMNQFPNLLTLLQPSRRRPRNLLSQLLRPQQCQWKPQTQVLSQFTLFLSQPIQLRQRPRKSPLPLHRLPRFLTLFLIQLNPRQRPPPSPRSKNSFLNQLPLRLNRFPKRPRKLLPNLLKHPRCQPKYLNPFEWTQRARIRLKRPWKLLRDLLKHPQTRLPNKLPPSRLRSLSIRLLNHRLCQQQA
eukprot:m.13445 g.13445  ORF g.13445 m.13445 type:complete len:351 (-) comp19889_c0_seq2:537-1589(-)